MLRLSWAGILAATAGIATAAERSAAPPLAWSDFLTLLRESSAAARTDHWDQAAHVREVEAWLRRLPLREVAALPERRLYGRARGPWPSYEHLRKEQDFEVDLVSFVGAGEIPHHDHPRMTGVSACVTGNVEVQRYDLVYPAASGQPAMLRDLGRRTLRPGETAGLTATAGNVHRVWTDGPAQIVDVFAPPYGSPLTGKTTWYRLAQPEHPREDGLLAAEPYQPT